MLHLAKIPLFCGLLWFGAIAFESHGAPPKRSGPLPTRRDTSPCASLLESASPLPPEILDAVREQLPLGEFHWEPPRLPDPNWARPTPEYFRLNRYSWVRYLSKSSWIVATVHHQSVGVWDLGGNLLFLLPPPSMEKFDVDWIDTDEDNSRIYVGRSPQLGNTWVISQYELSRSGVIRSEHFRLQP